MKEYLQFLMGINT